MNYILSIILDETLEDAYALVQEDKFDPNLLVLEVHAKSSQKIDFREMDISSFKMEMLDTFMNYFSYGKSVINNASLITIVCKDEEKKDYIEDIHRFLENNKDFYNKQVIVRHGIYEYEKEDYDKIKCFDEHENVKFVMDNLTDARSSKEIGKTIEIINTIVDKVKQYNLSALERAMLAYDLLRTNLAKTKNNDTKEEIEMNKFIDSFNEPADFYADVYSEILGKLDIRNLTGKGEFYEDEERKYTIAFIEDEKYDIDGVYYFDLASDSLRNTKNSLCSFPIESTKNDIHDTLLLYNGFAKTKADMETSGFLNYDYIFSDFDESYIDILDEIDDKNISRIIPQIVMNINNISNFIDGKDLIKNQKDLENDEIREKVQDKLQEYISLFTNNITASDFLSILFEVRKVEYFENKEVYKLSTDLLKEILYNSRVNFMNNYIDDDDIDFDDEPEIDEMLKENLEDSFDDFANRNNIDSKIKKLKLTLRNKDDNNEDKNK